MSLHTILKPNVCVEYLKNKISEKVTYLNIPRNINVKSLIEYSIMSLEKKLIKERLNE